MAARAGLILPALSLLAGAALLAWPAALNGYPLVFIDTVSYLLQTTAGELPWDKTPAYGPALHLLHWGWSLWPALAGQALAWSWLLRLAQRAARGGVSPAAHLLLCAGLGGLTAAPWVVATLMPDALTAALPLALWLLGWGRLSRAEALGVGALATLAAAAHLSHLAVGIGLAGLALLAGRWRPAVPVALAAAGLLAFNAAALGRTSLSPHGAVFLLARLQADGPALAVLRARCPEAGWRLCAQLAALPLDSDAFLWDPASPLNTEADGSPRPMGGVQGAAEARAILAATLATRPGEVAAAMLRNGWAQLGRVRVGDTLVADHLALSARRAVARFPPGELAAFDAAAQMRGALPGLAAPWLVPHLPVLLAALALAPLAAWRARRDVVRLALLAAALAALAGNALVAGGLSKPHDRYGARLVWLLPLAVALALAPRAQPALR